MDRRSDRSAITRRDRQRRAASVVPCLLDVCFRIRLRVSGRDNGGEGAESRRCVCNVDLGGLVHADLDTLVIALYVTVDELLGPRRGPGRRPKLTDAELVCLAVAQVLLGFGSERRWLRFADQRLGHLFPYLPTHRPTTGGCAAPPPGLLGHPGHRRPYAKLVRPTAAGRLHPAAVCGVAGDR